jgi:hypothetical protein
MLCISMEVGVLGAYVHLIYKKNIFLFLVLIYIFAFMVMEGNPRETQYIVLK